MKPLIPAILAAAGTDLESLIPASVERPPHPSDKIRRALSERMAENSRKAAAHNHEAALRGDIKSRAPKTPKVVEVTPLPQDTTIRDLIHAAWVKRAEPKSKPKAKRDRQLERGERARSRTRRQRLRSFWRAAVRASLPAVLRPEVMP